MYWPVPRPLTTSRSRFAPECAESPSRSRRAAAPRSKTVAVFLPQTWSVTFAFGFTVTVSRPFAGRYAR